MSILEHLITGSESKDTEQDKKTETNLSNQAELSSDLHTNIEIIKKKMGYASDIVVREFTIIPGIDIKAAVILIKGLSQRAVINDQVIGALMLNVSIKNAKNNIELFQILKEYGIPSTYVKEESILDNMLTELIDGNTILILDKVDKVLIVGSSGWNDRAISEPQAENVVRGPKDGFTENIENNIAMIRRRIKSPELRI